MNRLPLCTLALALVSTQALALPLDVTVPQLKTEYLECDRLATRTVLDAGTAAHCSRVAEALLQRGFGGRFEDLLAWWKENRLEAVVSR